jgi:hypothetical protein
MSAKKSKFGKIRKNKRASGELLFFSRSSHSTLYDYKVVGAVVLIHPVCIYLRSTFCFVTFPTHTL